MKRFFLLSSILFLFLSVFSQNEKAFFYSPDTVFLPDGSGVSYNSTILIGGYNAGQTINTVDEILDICVNMEHSYLGDIVISITCPNGTTVVLEEQDGGGTFLGDALDDGTTDPGIGWTYCWNSDPTFGTMGTEADSESILPPGTYTSSEDLSGLIGCPMNGNWTLTVTDNWAIDNGYIFNWGIDLLNEPNCFTLLTGRIYADFNENLTYDSTDATFSNKIVEAIPGPYYGYTDNNGIYRIFVDSGDYEIMQLNLGVLWEQTYPTSPLNHSVSVLTNDYDTISNLDFINSADIYCPLMNVDIVLNQVRICESSYATINYSNSGTINSDNTLITVELDTSFTYVSGGNLISQIGNTLTFDVGVVGILQSGQFTIYFDYSCDPDLLGVTECVEAHIYPDSLCTEFDASWDLSSISIDAFCSGDSLVCFTIYNNGSGNMQASSQYRIYEDNYIVYNAFFLIDANDSIEICWAANGRTIRLEADQRPGHPGNSHPQQSIELCGYPNASLGQILVVPQDDEDIFVGIDCQEILGAYDPNIKAVVPAGFLQEHFIDATDNLEYTIRFQNTGTAPATKVVVVDTISDLLNISSFAMLSSSHNYFVEILGTNVIKWTFENIMLPDSGTSELESHGFIKYKINQNTGNIDGSVIYNSAAIFFDYNFPIITNQVYNTIGDLPNITIQEIVYSSNDIVIYPNPTTGIVNVSAENINNIEVLDINGKILQKLTTNKIDLSNQPKGMYFIRITTDKYVAVEKIVLE